MLSGLEVFFSKTALALLLCTSVQFYGISQVDSLENLLDKTEGTDKVDVLNNLFKAYVNNDPFLALSYARSALQISKDIEYPKGEATSYNDIGVVHRKHGKLDLALENYLNAFDIYSEIGDSKGLAKVFNNIGTVYSLQGESEKALENYKNSYDLLKKIGDDDLIVGSLNNIGNVYKDRGDHEEALRYYEEALEIYTAGGKSLKAFEPLTSMGNIYFENGEYDRALNSYFEALEIERGNNDLYGQAFALNNIGIVYFNKKEYKMAISFQNQALNLAAEIKSLRLLGNIYEALSKSYFANDEVLNAYNALQLYQAVKDSLNDKEMTKRLMELESRYEFEKQQNMEEMKNMGKDIQKLESKNEQKNLLIMVMVGIILISIFIGFFRKKFLT